MPNLTPTRRQGAFTLVELMIALTLGSLIILAVTQVYLSSAQTQRLNNELALLNDKSLFALELIERNLREAGFGSCAPESSLGDWVNWGAANSMSAMLRLNVGIRGFEHTGTQRNNSYTLPGSRSFTETPSAPIPNNTLSGSDILVLQHRNTQQVTVMGPAASGATLGNNSLCLGGIAQAGHQIQIQQSAAIPANSLVFLEEGCKSGDLFVSSTSTSAGIVSLNKNNAFNLLGSGVAGFCNSYQVGSEISLTVIEQRAFFVANNSSGEPSLFMQTFGTTNQQSALEEIISGVEAMQITYGLHNNASTRTVSNYVSANNVVNWQHVVSVNISLLLRSNNNVLPESQSKSFNVNGTTLVAPADRRARLVLSSTTAIRNQTL